MTATTITKPNTSPPSSFSYADELFSQFAFRGSSSPRFRLPPSKCPSKSNHQNPLPEEFTQKSRILMVQDSPISTLDDLQTSEEAKKASGHEIPILSIEDLQHNPKREIHTLTLEDLQEVSPNAPSLEVQRVLAREPPIITLEDLQNAKSDHLPAKNPPRAGRVLQFDQQMLQTTPPSVRNSIPAQQGVLVVSPYFQNTKSTQQGQRIVSRYFQNLELERAAHNEDVNATDHRSKRSRLGDKRASRSKSYRHSIRKASRSVQKLGTDKRVRSVLRYFQNSETNQQGERVVSRFFQTLEKQVVNSQQEVIEQPNQCAKSVRRIRKPAKGRKQRDESSARPRTTLSSAELYLEAYRRKSLEDTWKPPPSGIRLLQQDHAFDPWRVLVICMLLNRTTGQQAKEVIPKLFTLCPNPKAALEVSQEQIEDIIRPLGLQRKRSRTMQQLSEMYLKESWSHVTQLPGVDSPNFENAGWKLPDSFQKPKLGKSVPSMAANFWTSSHYKQLLDQEELDKKKGASLLMTSYGQLYIEVGYTCESKTNVVVVWLFSFIISLFFIMS